MIELAEVRNFVLNGSLFGPAEQLIADLAVRIAGNDSPELYLAMLLTMQSLQQKHVCIKLPEKANTLLTDPLTQKQLKLPDYPAWRAALERSRPAAAVLTKEQETQVPEAMLILDSSGGCYLQRQWSFECSIKNALLKRAVHNYELPELPGFALQKVSKLFPSKATHPEPDYQQLAAAAALQKKLLIISGGPGTGKTTVAAAILALKLSLQPDLKIALAAPTAKAAVRLLESLHENLDKLQVSDCIKAQLSTLQSSTLHRLLGVQSSSHDFKHNINNLLNCDLLLIDECSMVPQELMARTLEALPDEAQLLLLGDRYQLSSVEAGSVMADLCDSAAPNQVDEKLSEFFFQQTAWQISPAPPAELQKAPLTGCIIELQENHRFAHSSQLLGAIAGAIRNLQTPDDALQSAGWIAQSRGEEFAMPGSSDDEYKKFIRQELEKPRTLSLDNQSFTASFRQLPMLCSGEWPAPQRAFALLNSLKLLAPSYKGMWGLEKLNALCMQILDFTDLHAVGMPLLITRNDYRCGLFNGDIGLIVRTPGSSRKQVFFQEHPERLFMLEELPEHEPVFAMSVHKSQGSGFDEVIFIMPEKSGELMTREMVYTAMTRAKKQLFCLGSSHVLAAALATPGCRISNLTRKLRQDV